MVPLLTPYDLPFPQNEGFKCHAYEQLRDMCCHLADMIEEWCLKLLNSVVH